MKKLCLMALILFGLASAAPALAAGQAERLMEQSRQSYVQGRVEQAIVELREAVVQMWQEADLWIEQAVLVNGRAQGYGIYEPRTSNAYTTGQPILVYLEPLGYRHRRTPDGKYNFGLTCDLVVKLPTGEIVAQQRNFQRIDMTSAKPNMELFFVPDLHLERSETGQIHPGYGLARSDRRLHGQRGHGGGHHQIARPGPGAGNQRPHPAV